MIAVVNTSRLAEAVFMYFLMGLLLVGFAIVFSIIKIRRQTPKKIKAEADEHRFRRLWKEAEKD